MPTVLLSRLSNLISLSLFILLPFVHVFTYVSQMLSSALCYLFVCSLFLLSSHACVGSFTLINYFSLNNSATCRRIPTDGGGGGGARRSFQFVGLFYRGRTCPVAFLFRKRMSFVKDVWNALANFSLDYHRMELEHSPTLPQVQPSPARSRTAHLLSLGSSADPFGRRTSIGTQVVVGRGMLPACAGSVKPRTRLATCPVPSVDHFQTIRDELHDEHLKSVIQVQIEHCEKTINLCRLKDRSEKVTSRWNLHCSQSRPVGSQSSAS